MDNCILEGYIFLRTTTLFIIFAGIIQLTSGAMNTNTFFLEGSISRGEESFANFTGFGDVSHRIETIHLKFVKLNWTLFAEELERIGADSVSSIIFYRVRVSGKIGRVYLPALKSFSLSDNDYQQELRPKLFFEKERDRSWDWSELWSLGVDVDVCLSSFADQIIRLNHSTHELIWKVFLWDQGILEQILKGCLSQIQRLTLHVYRIQFGVDAFPTNLSYLSFHVTKDISLNWEQMEDCIFKNSNLKELHVGFNEVESQIVISKLPTNLSSLRLYGKCSVHVSHEFNNLSSGELMDLEQLCFTGVTLSNETLEGLPKYFNIKRLGFTRDIWNSGSGTRLRYKHLENILKISNLNFVFVNPLVFLDQDDTPVTDSSSIRDIVQASNIRQDSEGFVLQKGEGTGWSARRIFLREYSFAAAMFEGSGAHDFKLETISAKCLPPTCSKDHESCGNRVMLDMGRRGLLKYLEASALCNQLETVDFGLNQSGIEIDELFLTELFTSCPKLSKITFHPIENVRISKKIRPEVSVQFPYSQYFEPRYYVPFDLSLLTPNIRNVALKQTLFKISDVSKTVSLDALALNGCPLQRIYFNKFKELFGGVKQISISPPPTDFIRQIEIAQPPLYFITSLSLYLKYFEDGIAGFDFFNDSNVFRVNHELLHILLNPELIQLETIVLTGFDSKFQHSSRAPVVEILKSAGIREWDISFVLQKVPNGLGEWKGFPLSTDMTEIHDKAFNAERLEYLVPDECTAGGESPVDGDNEIEDSNVRPRKKLEFVLDGFINVPALFPAPKPQAVIERTPFLGFLDTPVESIHIENAEIDADLFSEELRKLNPFKVVEIVLDNVKISGRICNLELPNVRRFVLSTPDQVQTSTRDKENFFKEYLFFVSENSNRTLNDVFRTTDILLQFGGETYLEITRTISGGRIISKGFYYRQANCGSSSSIGYANNILESSTLENIKTMHIFHQTLNLPLYTSMLDINNNVTELVLIRIDKEPGQIELFLQKFPKLEKLILDSDLEFGIVSELKNLKHLVLSVSDTKKLGRIPTSPLNLESLVLVFHRQAEDIQFHKYFNSKRVFVHTYGMGEGSNDSPMSSMHVQTPEFFNSILKSDAVEFIFLGNLAQKLITHIPEAVAEFQNLSLDFNQFGEFKDSAFLNEASASAFDRKHVLLKDTWTGEWKAVHFLDIPTISTSFFRIDKYYEYSNDIYERAKVLHEKSVHFSGFSAQESDVAITSIKLSNVILKASEFLKDIKNPNYIKSISMNNVKVFGKFPKIHLPSLTSFKLHLHKSEKLTAQNLAIWPVMESFLFFLPGRLENLWDSKVDVSIGVGREKIFEISHSNSSCVSRLENSNEVLHVIPSLRHLALNCKMSPIFPPGGDLRVLRLENVVMSWAEVEAVLEANINIEELYFEPYNLGGRGFQTHLPIVLNKFPNSKSLKVLSFGNVKITFGASYKKLELETLILSSVTFESKTIGKDFSNYFNVRRVGLFIAYSVLCPLFVHSKLINPSELEELWGDGYHYVGDYYAEGKPEKHAENQANEFLEKIGATKPGFDRTVYNLHLKKVDGQWIPGAEYEIMRMWDANDFRKFEIYNDTVSQMFYLN